MSTHDIFLQKVKDGQWIFDIRKYNTENSLSDTEKLAIKQYLDLEKTKKSKATRDAIASDFERILSPIADTLEYLNMAKKPKNAITRLILEHILFLNCNIWGWKPDEIIYFINDLREKRSHHPYNNPITALFYVINGFKDFEKVQPINYPFIARRVFGEELYENVISRLCNELLEQGISEYRVSNSLPGALSFVFLHNYSLSIQDLSYDFLMDLYKKASMAREKTGIVNLLSYLKSMGSITETFEPYWQNRINTPSSPNLLVDIAEDWVKSCQEWRDKAPRSEKHKRQTYYNLLKIGRWLASMFPNIKHPRDWTRKTAIAFTAMCSELKVGEFSSQNHHNNKGEAAAPGTIADLLNSAKIFFLDCQELGWIDYRFDPHIYFSLPKHVRDQDEVRPRLIEDDIWGKLLSAAVDLELKDVYPSATEASAGLNNLHPIEMLQAMGIVWLFAGLRSSEIRRLRLDCITWPDTKNGESICLLKVPIGKSKNPQIKPVETIVADAIKAWQDVRPSTQKFFDKVTNTEEDFLFSYNNKFIGVYFLNTDLIPALCRKANIPTSDKIGNITSHRTRSTMASKLANSGMTMLYVKEWLGHANINSTTRYLAVDEDRLAQAYNDAAYYTDKMRQINVLIDRAAVESGAAKNGEVWKYYDLIHGLCTYDFFQKCPHLLACAKCSYYIPGESIKAQLLEANTNLLRLRESIKLDDETRAVIDAGIKAVENLSKRLENVPTPAGPTPKQLNGKPSVPNLAMFDDRETPDTPPKTPE